MTIAANNPAGGAATNAALVARLAAVECPAFAQRRKRRPGAEHSSPAMVLVRGEGSYLEDVEGRRFLDLAAGFGSVLLGHGHRALRAAISAQSEQLIQGLGDVYASDTKLRLLERLAALYPEPGAKVLLTQSGADAVTAALKTAVLATGRVGVIAFDGAYHGLGFAPLPACGYARSFREPFAAQLNPHVRFAPYPGMRGASALASLEMVEDLLRAGNIGAVLVEPVAGRGGCVVPPDGFLMQLGMLARRYGALLVADEIWTGLGRSGAMLRSVVQSAQPDVVCVGKGLGGGLPISACIARDEVMQAWAQGGLVVHTSTHAGAPLGCAAALAVLDTVARQQLIARAQKLGRVWRQRLRAHLADCPALQQVRGVGLMVGVELDSAASAQRAVAGLVERGVIAITGGIDGACLTLTPPLTVDEDALLGMAPLLAAALNEPPPSQR